MIENELLLTNQLLDLLMSSVCKDFVFNDDYTLKKNVRVSIQANALRVISDCIKVKKELNVNDSILCHAILLSFNNSEPLIRENVILILGNYVCHESHAKESNVHKELLDILILVSHFVTLYT